MNIQFEQTIKKYKNELLDFSKRQKNIEFGQVYKGTNKDECYGVIDDISFSVCNRFDNEKLNLFYDKFRGELFDIIKQNLCGLITREVIIDGNKFSDLEGFYCQMESLLTNGLNWKPGHNLDAFEDVLKGGYGVTEEGETLVVKWKNYAKSKKDLGNEIILKLLETICDFNNTGHKCKLELY